MLPMSFLVPGALLLSFAPILVKASALHPDLMGFYRMLFGMLWLGGHLLLTRSKPQGKWLQPLPLLAGVAFALDLILWHRSIHSIGPGLATMLANLQVLVVAGWGFLRGQEKPSGRFWLSTALALGGLWLIVSASALPQGELVPGLILALTAALAYSWYLILLKRVEQDSVDASSQSMIQVSLSSCLVLGLSGLATQAQFAIPDLRALAYLLAYGCLIQGLAWMLIAHAMKKLPAFQVSLVLLLQPVLSLVWDVVIFHRRLTPAEMLGMALTLVAIWLGAGASRTSEAKVMEEALGETN